MAARKCRGDTRDFGRSLGLAVCNTPSYSPQSNGMAQAFVETFKRNYVYLEEPKTARDVLEKVPDWFENYNENGPHKGLKMKSPREYRRANAEREASNDLLHQ